METATIAKQMICFQKNYLDNTFNAMAIVQDQTENIFNGFLNQFPWVTAGGKKTLNDTMQFAKKTRDEFKKALDDGYARMEETRMEELYETKIDEFKKALDDGYARMTLMEELYESKIEEFKKALDDGYARMEELCETKMQNNL